MTEPRRSPRWNRRRRLVAGAFLAAGGVLVARAVDLQVLDTGFLRDQARARQVRSVEIPAHRGTITDRNGEPLAVSTPVGSIWVNPGRILGEPGAVEKLAAALDERAGPLRESLQSRRDREFLYVRRHMAPPAARAVIDKGLPGVYLQREYRRYYPTGEVAGHVLGFTNIDDRGQEGLELAYDDWLRGEPGRRRVIKDRLGHTIDDLGRLEAPRPGRDLTLSLDRRVQYLAYRELKSAVAEHGAASGSIVVLDAETGEVLAMANQPGFNPNDRGSLSGRRYRNRAVTDVFEPGSAFKPFVVGAALQHDRVDAGDRIDTAPGYYRVQGQLIRDHRNHGVLDVAHVLSVSSNVGASRIALQMAPANLYRTLQGFGFGEVTASGFPGERAGELSHYQQWRRLRQATLAYGYGVSVTTLQLARAYAAIATDGVVRPVSFVRIEERAEGRRVLAAATARTLRRMLEGVVEHGTGERAAIHGYRVAGKTGTARKVGASGYTDRYVAVFAGMLPASAPRLVGVVMINEPGGDAYYGGEVAAPVFARVMRGAARLLDIPPDDLPPGRGVVSAPPPRSPGDRG